MELSPREMIFPQLGARTALSIFWTLSVFHKDPNFVICFPSAKSDWLTGGKNQFGTTTKMIGFYVLTLFMVVWEPSGSRRRRYRAFA